MDASELNFKAIEEKWQRNWAESKLFEPETDQREKFYLTVPYPYTSGPLHIGHGRTYTIGDIIARFKRLQGYNVLFPMAFHVTGTPILAIADSIARGDASVIARYRDYISIYEDPAQVDEILQTFNGPENVAAFFATRISEDFKQMGYSIDWRRRFNTMEPMYNKFIEWQFKKLYDTGVIKKGKYPITYSCVEGCAVGEDDIGEGDTDKVSIIEYTAIKFKLCDEDAYLLAATLRPETIFGVTNIWIKPEATYVRVRVNDEVWIVSREAAEKLSYQREGIDVLDELKGEDLLWKAATELVEDREIPIFPASLVDEDVGTGVVYSVPAHAPYDYMGLEDLRRDRGIELEPIKVIDIEGYDLPAKEICEQMCIVSQDDERLEEATQIIYKDEFYRGVLNERCRQFSGIEIAQIKDQVKDWLQAENISDIFYETSRKAVTRGGSKVIVAVLQDQWFIDYTPHWWKDEGHKLVAQMTFYPEKYKTYMHDIIDWLAFRPCARKRGLGTQFPFERGWIIESLSDSTIYMAMYTIAHLLRDVPVEALDEQFFDYVLLGTGDAERVAKECSLEVAALEQLRREFTYWYPNDQRHTAPPHLSNHLVFFIMHHAAIFPQEHWPKAITLNELMIREGRKISKSKGNVIPLARVSELYGVDLYRLYCALNADFATVVNWREQDTDALRRRFHALITVFMESVDAEPLRAEEYTHIDLWLLSRFYRRLKQSYELFEGFRIREGGINMVFNLMNDLRYYEKRASIERRQRIVRNVLDDWLIMLSPLVPHICEELWHKRHDSFVSLEILPRIKTELVNAQMEREEDYLRALVADIQEILKVARIEPRKIYLYSADAASEQWKWELFKALKDVPEKEKIREAMQIRKDKSTLNFVKQLLKSNIEYAELDESAILAREQAYLSREFGCEIGVNEEHDPTGKRTFAIPLKPAIYVAG
jgi:leucyl-tRNA synthetase